MDVPPEPYDAPRRAPAPTPEPEPAPVAAGLTVQQVSARWPEIRAAVRAQSSVLEAMLSAAFVHDVTGSEIVLGHPHSALVGRLSDQRGLRALTTALGDVFGPGNTVRVVQATPDSAPAAATAPAAQEPPKRQAFTRPSRPREEQPPAPEPEPEPEPEPLTADEDLTDDERDEMVAEAQNSAPDARLDPDQVALELLKSELGARPVE